MCRFGATFQLFRRDVFFVGSNGPDVPEGIHQSSRSIAIKLILNRPLLPSAGSDRLAKNFTKSAAVIHEPDRLASLRLGRLAANSRKSTAAKTWEFPILNS